MSARTARGVSDARSSALDAAHLERQLLQRVPGVLVRGLVDDHLADDRGRAAEAEGRLLRQRLLVEARAEILGAEEALLMMTRRGSPRKALDAEGPASP
jgi:hypothetical protein